MLSILYLQVVLTTLAVIGFFAFQGGAAALAAAFGGAITLVNTSLLLWRMNRSQRSGPLGAHATLRGLLFSAGERFAAVAFMFALGMGILRLQPMPLLIGFCLSMLALVSLAKSGRV